MGQILQNWRILGAAFLSVSFIVGAFLLARSVESPNFAQASPESALLKAIATKDSDGDGLTDWEEALYGTSPNITDTFNLGMTDSEAVTKGLIVPKAIADISLATSSVASMPADGSLPPPPGEGTLTDTFAKSFFTLYISAKQANGGTDLSEADMQNIASEAISSLSSAVIMAPDFKSAKDLKISGSGADTLKEFAVNAEAVLLKNTSTALKSELLYLIDAVENNDTDALAHIASIAKAYRDSAAGLAALSIPAELAESHLALINAMMRV
ncbi:MAG: thrombospondin type 3 repeat-containing protein, partial [Patescibacteria group bacterium]